MAYTLQSKVGELLKDTEAVKVVEKYSPGLSKNPMIGMVKGMTLEKLIEVPQAKQAGLTKEMLVKVLDEINKKK